MGSEIAYYQREAQVESETLLDSEAPFPIKDNTFGIMDQVIGDVPARDDLGKIFVKPEDEHRVVCVDHTDLAKELWLPEKLKGCRYIVNGDVMYGGLGAVYEAYDRITGDKVAIKGMAPYLREDPRFKNIIEGEIKSLILASRINGVVEIKDVLRMDDETSVEFPEVTQGWHLVEEYLDPNNFTCLRELIGKASSLEEKFRILRAVARTVDEIHRTGLNHGDLKPESIYVSGDEIKIIDFGLSRIAIGPGVLTRVDQMHPNGSSETVWQGDIVGTPRYLAPEVFSNQETSIEADLYQFGLVAYEVFTGRTPFSEPDVSNTYTMLYQILQRSREEFQFSKSVPGLGANHRDEFNNIFKRMLSADPEQRYDSADEFIEELSRMFNQ